MTANLDAFGKVYGLMCHVSGCQAEGDCEKLAGKYGGEHFDRCPIALINESTDFAVCLDLYAASKVSPIEGWPSCFSPWIVKTVVELHRELEKVQAESIKAVTRGKG